MKTMKEFAQITLWKSHNEEVGHQSLFPFFFFQLEEIGLAGWSDCLYFFLASLKALRWREENFRIFPL